MSFKAPLYILEKKFHVFLTICAKHQNDLEQGHMTIELQEIADLCDTRKTKASINLYMEWLKLPWVRDLIRCHMQYWSEKKQIFIKAWASETTFIIYLTFCKLHPHFINRSQTEIRGFLKASNPNLSIGQINQYPKQFWKELTMLYNNDELVMVNEKFYTSHLLDPNEYFGKISNAPSLATAKVALTRRAVEVDWPEVHSLLLEGQAAQKKAFARLDAFLASHGDEGYAVAGNFPRMMAEQRLVDAVVKPKKRHQQAQEAAEEVQRIKEEI